MAGIGIRLNRIFSRGTIVANLLGFGYSMIVTVTPMFVIIGNVALMSNVLGYDTLEYAQRNLFSGVLLYIFVFSQLTASPFNAVISRFLSDAIYDESYGDIMPCYYTGMVLNVALSCLVGIPFCIYACLVGNIALYYMFTGFCGYIALVLVFYSMLYLSICKDYQKISLFFLIGMIFSFLLSLLFVYVLGMEVTYSMLLALTLGFLCTAILENATIRRYFQRNSNQYRKVLFYFKKYWKLVVINSGYSLGLYVHNFVFWDSKLKMVISNTFVMAPSYDLATCLAMFTNISATVIFISRVEMHFHERYKTYSEAVTGGRWQDINNTKNRMFRQLSAELLNLVRLQFIVSVVVYLVFLVFLPRFGFAGLPLIIYPCVAAGYFILFVMYAAIIFLYYFNDLNGAMLTSLSFCLITFLISFFSRSLPEIWYGLGVVIGSVVGFIAAYGRLRWVERHLDEHIFCRGILFPVKKAKRPPSRVYKKQTE